MIVSDVMDELGGRLEEIPDLRVMPWAATRIAPPAALISLPPSLTYNQTYGRGGMNRLTLVISILVGWSTDRTSRDEITKYLDSVGPYSIREKINTGRYRSCDTAVVTSGNTAFVKIAQQKFLGAIFQTDISGVGA